MYHFFIVLTPKVQNSFRCSCILSENIVKRRSYFFPHNKNVAFYVSDDVLKSSKSNEYHFSKTYFLDLKYVVMQLVDLKKL